MSSTMWGSQGACPLAKYEAAPHARLSAPSASRPGSSLVPSNGRPTPAPWAEAPFPSSQVIFGAVENCQGRRLRRRSEPLTNLHRSVRCKFQGKGAGVSGGLVPLAGFGQRPDRPGGRRLARIYPFAAMLELPLRRAACCPIAILPLSSAIEAPSVDVLLARSASAADTPCFHSHSPVSSNARCMLGSVFRKNGCCNL